MRLQKRSLKKARIEIIPMIDTIFFLLVFFMVATLSMAQFRGVEVNLPKSASGRDAPAENTMITITRERLIYLDKVPIEPGRLRQSLARQLERTPNLLVIINADEGVEHGKVVEIMDEARQAGVKKLSIAVKSKD
jgi:biopolymer transport protein ExbD